MEKMPVVLTGKTALVTGAGAGLGEAIAVGLAQAGAAVALVDRREAAARAAAARIEAAGGRALALAGDVEDGAQAHDLVAETMARLGRLDILVNNVGGGLRQPFLDSAEADWDYLIRHNLKSTLHCTQAAAQAMIAQGEGGSILNVSSLQAHRGGPNYAVYAATKAAVENFTKSMALELGPHAIRVNAIAPELIVTEKLRATLGPEGAARVARHIPLGRPGRPEDAAGAAVFFASALSAWITGVTLHVDGGNHAAAGWQYDPAQGWVI